MTRTLRVAGRAAGVLMVLAALPGLSACTPEAKPLTAIRAVDGEPVILLAGCPDFQIDSVSVYTESGDPTVAVDGPDRVLRRNGAPLPESLSLFGASPAGWTVTDERLTELAAGKSYGLSAFGDGGNVVPVTFTAADLAALGPGDVLIGKTPSSHEKVTEKEFRRQATEAC
ncbi:hypothetical protein [Actinoplanes sp. NPDC051859]|uniref:hypothetical protein n=1 Tax=Actinoplanes sp. NPDC051859 TaxID=3363909 RepID=UPI0037BD6D1B